VRYPLIFAVVAAFFQAATASAQVTADSRLQPIFKLFESQASPGQLSQMKAALASSPSLRGQLSALASSGKLTAVRLQASGDPGPPGPFTGWQDRGAIISTSAFLTAQGGKPHL
jgi:hypothetical protein